jgi:hypothetical protein
MASPMTEGFQDCFSFYPIPRGEIIAILLSASFNRLLNWWITARLTSGLSRISPSKSF